LITTTNDSIIKEKIEDSDMSETEYSRLADKLDNLTEIVYKMDERLKDLPELTSKVATHETEILMNKQSIKSCKERCDSVQKEKEKKNVPWGNVKSGVIVGIVVGIIMLGINLFVTYQLLGGK
jgi:Fe2+ transport system protein B